MDRAHNVQDLVFVGTNLHLRVDGKAYEIDILSHSQRLAEATPEQRARFEVTPSGYGLHWPEIDEDLSNDGLLGVRHAGPVANRTP